MDSVLRNILHRPAIINPNCAGTQPHFQYQYESWQAEVNRNSEEEIETAISPPPLDLSPSQVNSGNNIAQAMAQQVDVESLPNLSEPQCHYLFPDPQLQMLQNKQLSQTVDSQQRLLQLKNDAIQDCLVKQSRLKLKLKALKKNTISKTKYVELVEQNLRLAQQKEELEETVKQLDISVGRKLMENGRLSEQWETLQKQQQTSRVNTDNKMKKLEEELNRYKSKALESYAKMMHTDSKVRKLNSEVNSLRDQVTSLTNTNDFLKKNADDSQKEVETVKNEFLKTTSKHAEELHKINEQLNEIQIKLKNSEQSMETLSREREQLVQQNELANITIQQNGLKIDELELEINDYASKVARKSNVLAAEKKLRFESENDLEKANDQVKNLEDQVENLKLKNYSLSHQLDLRIDEATQLQYDIEDLQQFNKEITKEKDDLKKLVEELQLAVEQNATSLEALEFYETEIFNLESKVKEYERKLKNKGLEKTTMTMSMDVMQEGNEAEQM